MVAVTAAEPAAAMPTVRRAPLRDLIAAGAGDRMISLARRMFALPRSITGDGVRATLALLAERFALQQHEVPTGTRVFDWTVPDEWNIREAWIADTSGRRIVDFADSTLHVVGYSEPVRQRMSLADLAPRLHTVPQRPDAIPYRNAFYHRSWGFCLSDRQRAAMVDGEYDVFIDASLQPGSLSYGECLLPGAVTDEVLLYAHCCHPALANDNLSALVVLSELAQALSRVPRRWSYRIVCAPTTIGAITWLATNAQAVERIRHGLVLACLGDPGRLTYKRTRNEGASIDTAVLAALTSVRDLDVRDFSPWGYDERQFCSPGIDLPVGRLTRTPNGEYPQYHTSDDDLTLITAAALEDSLDALCRIIDVLETDAKPLNLSPYGEPQLGRRGLFGKTGGTGQLKLRESALLWVLNLSDGKHRLSDIALRSQLPYAVVLDAALDLAAVELLRL